MSSSLKVMQLLPVVCINSCVLSIKIRGFVEYNHLGDTIKEAYSGFDVEAVQVTRTLEYLSGFS